MPFPITKIKLIDEGVAGYSDGFVLSRNSSLGEADVESFYVKVMKAISDKAVLEKGMGIPVYRTQDLKKTSFKTLKACDNLFPKNYYHGAYDKLLSSEAAEKYNVAILDFLTGKIDEETFSNEITKR